jgi:hypothetical protein
VKIYIAASWKHQHAVELLTDLLEKSGHQVVSFVREAATSGELRAVGGLEEWIDSEDGLRKFEFDTQGAMSADAVVYIGPSGTDAWAEVGAAWALDVPVLGLWAKGEPAGLMRRMVCWFDNHRHLVAALNNGADVGRFRRPWPEPPWPEPPEVPAKSEAPEWTKLGWTEGQREALLLVLADNRRMPVGGGPLYVGQCPSCKNGQIAYQRLGGVVGQIKIWCTVCGLKVEA